MLVGRPGHAALRELCDRIVANAERDFHTNPNTATLLRTGPGVFTDVVLKYALSYPVSPSGSPCYFCFLCSQIAGLSYN